MTVPRHFGLSSSLVFLALTSACGSASITTPEGLPITTYAAGDVTLTFVMSTCSDVCVTYETAECEAEVDGREIVVDVEVSYDDTDGRNRSDLRQCPQTCGAPVLAHCQVSDLDPGTYKVVADSFTATIVVERAAPAS